MNDLMAFLNARLDEDEAEAASHAGPPSVRRRQRREVEAKRAVIAEWRDHQLERDDVASYTDGLADGLDLAARHFAAIYNDHQDYRQEWAP